jgi:hypothetical protein
VCLNGGCTLQKHAKAVLAHAARVGANEMRLFERNSEFPNYQMLLQEIELSHVGGSHTTVLPSITNVFAANFRVLQGLISLPSQVST